MERIVSSEPLTDAECRTLAPANSRKLAQSIAGRALALYELASGDSPIAAGLTAVNPQGRLGVDRSGPPWGDAHRHPLLSCEYLLATANIAGDPKSLVELTALDQRYLVPMRLYVRPFADSPLAPYSRGLLQIVMERIGAATSSVEVTVRTDDGPTVVTRSTSAAGVIVLTTAVNVPLSPAVVQTPIAEIRLTSAAPNGMRILAVTLSQTQRTSH
jgi:hypothetical protein